MKVLFICVGNVGRSQMAEAIFNNLFKGMHTAISAGTQVSKENQKIKDRDPNIVAVMKEIGIDVSENMRNQLTPEILREADEVVVMAEKETIPDYLNQNKKAIFWKVADPKGQTLEFAREVRDQIQALVNDFIITLPK